METNEDKEPDEESLVRAATMRKEQTLKIDEEEKEETYSQQQEHKLRKQSNNQLQIKARAQ